MDLGLVGSPASSPNLSLYSQANAYESTSDSSTPNSPPMVNNNQLAAEMFYYGADASTYYASQSSGISSDLSSSRFEDGDRRRKRSSNASRQKDTTPQMHLQRRRAQNRASQRAFRERKEKHVKGLEHQLDDLHEKHQDLLQSYSRQNDEVAKLNAKIRELSTEIEILRSTNDASLSELLANDRFEAMPFYVGPEYCLDRGPIEALQNCAASSLDDCL